MTSAALNASHPSSGTARSAATLAFAAAVLGTLGIFVTEARLDPVAIVFYRCLFGGIVMTLYCLWRGGLNLRAVPRRQLALAGASGLLMTGNWVAFFAAIQQAGIGVSTVVFHVQPVWLVLLGPVLFGERLRISAVAWIPVALAGLVMAVGLTPRELLGHGHNGYLNGIALSLLASLCYTGVTVIAKGARQITPQALTWIQCWTGVLVLPFFVPAGGLAIDTRQLVWLAGLGAIHTGAVYALIYGMLPKLATPVIAALLYIYPVSAALCDGLAFGHLLHPVQWLGLACIVCAGLGMNIGWGWRRRGAAPGQRQVRQG